MGSKHRKAERREIMRRNAHRLRDPDWESVDCGECQHCVCKTILWQLIFTCELLGKIVCVVDPGTADGGPGYAPKECPRRQKKPDGTPLLLS